MQEMLQEPRNIFSFLISRIVLSIVFFLSLAFRVNGLAAVSGGVLLLILATGFWTRLASKSLSILVSTDHDRLFPGESMQLSLILDNRKLLPLWVRIQLNLSKLLSAGGNHTLTGETNLFPFDIKTRQWQLKAAGRGVAGLGQGMTTAGDMLGLHQRPLVPTLPGEIIIFPRLGKLMPLHIPFQEFFGIHSSKGPVEDPAWYAGTRDYSGNRPARNIHWKASARLAKLQEKLYEPTSHRKVLLVLDTAGFIKTPDENAEDQAVQDRQEALEHLITTAATLAHTLMETGASFGFITNAGLIGSDHHQLPMGRGPEQLGTILEMLARIDSKTGRKVPDLIPGTDSTDLGILYCGYEAGPASYRLAVSGAPRRSRLLFIFSRPPAEGEENTGETVQHQARIFYYEGFPALIAREVVHAE